MTNKTKEALPAVARAEVPAAKSEQDVSGRTEAGHAATANDAEVDDISVEEFLDLVRKGGDDVPPGARALVSRLDAAEAALETANEEIATLTAKVEAAEKAAAKAKAKPKVSAGPPVPKARKFALPKEDERIGKTDLLEAIRAADTVEVLFCENGREVLGVPPHLVSGDAWQARLQGVMLTVPIEIAGPQPGKTPFAIDGFALLLDGKAATYARRAGGTLHVGVGQSRRIADDIIF